jgi:hypothetical protein
LLIGAGVSILIGGALGGTLNAIRQAIRIHEHPGTEFSWSDVGLAAGLGAVMGPFLFIAPELAIPLAAYGVYQGAGEISEGDYETGAFDIVTSLAPFALKGVRTATFGKGSVFAPARGLGPSATATERFARLPTLGRTTNDLAGRIWNERLYHGTDLASAQQAVSDIRTHLRWVRVLQQLPGARHLGDGLYFGRVPGDPTIPGSPLWWAQQGGSTGRPGPSALLEASVPRWRFFLISREPGVQLDIPQAGFTHPDTRQAFFPFEGPPNQIAGPAARLADAARWRIVDPKQIVAPNAAEPDLSGLFPLLVSPGAHWPPGPERGRAGK